MLFNCFGASMFATSHSRHGRQPRIEVQAFIVSNDTLLA